MIGSGVGIFSCDDHVVEPPHVWESRLPAAYRGVGPRIVRERVQGYWEKSGFVYEVSDDGAWTDCWLFEDLKVPTARLSAPVGLEVDAIDNRTITFDEMRMGCYDPVARLADMDVAGIDAQVCFPNVFVRFCGQTFLEAQDKDLALLCVRAYNDFIVDEWCAGSGGRLVPLGIVPMWDPELAAAEVRRNAGRGFRAVCFSEMPTYLGLPSIHTDHWNPFLRACEETGTVVMMHIGSGSRLASTSEDAPMAVTNTVQSLTTSLALTDWLFSGKLQAFPGLRIAFAESNVGWVPYVAQRADRVWEHTRSWNGVSHFLKEPPSSAIPGRVYFSFFDDVMGLGILEQIGVDNVMFETDYPHADSNWPDSTQVGNDQTSHLPPEWKRKVLRDNAHRLFTQPT